MDMHAKKLKKKKVSTFFFHLFCSLVTVIVSAAVSFQGLEYCGERERERESSRNEGYQKEHLLILFNCSA